MNNIYRFFLIILFASGFAGVFAAPPDPDIPSSKARILKLTQNQANYGDPFIDNYIILIQGCPEDDLVSVIFSVNNEADTLLADDPVFDDAYADESYTFYIPFYVSEYFNTIDIMVEFPDEDLIGKDTVYYCKPEIEINEIIDFDGDIYAPPDFIDFNVVNDSSITLQTHYSAACYVGDGSEVITRYQVDLNGTSYIYEGFEPNFEDDIVLKLGEEGLPYLRGGANTLTIRAIGNYPAVNPTEASDPVTVNIFYLDVDMSGLPNDTLCRYDQYFELKGIPEGGKFKGEGILGETNVFYPPIGLDFINEFWYCFNADGVNDSVKHAVTILPLPEVQGLTEKTNLEVCGYQYGTSYSFDVTDGASISDIVVENGLLMESSGNNIVIDWQEPGEGKITIEVTGNDPGQCKSSAYFWVDIGYNKAPKDSAYLALTDRMLFCSDKTVNYYYWLWSNGEFSDSLLGVTNTAYFYLPFVPGDPDKFAVETAYDTLTGCKRHSHELLMSDRSTNKLDMIGSVFNKDQSLNIFPNPVSSGYTYINLYNELTGNFVLEIYNMTGLCLFRENVDKESMFWSYRLNTGDRLSSPGMYLVRVSNGKYSASKKLVVR